MKKIKTLVAAFCFLAESLFYSSLFAQAPNSFNYQAVLRDGSGNLLTSGLTELRFTIHTASATGAVQFQETKTLTPNQYGLVNHMVGTGAIVSGTIAGVTWGSGNKFLQVELNTGSGFVDLGTQQLVSVPFALETKHATNADNATSATSATNASTASTSLDNKWTASGNNITNNNSGRVNVLNELAVLCPGGSITEGLRLIKQGAGQWNLYPGNADNSLALYFDASLRGKFDFISGSYSGISDERLKSNITGIGSVLNKVMLLDVKRYTFKSDATNKKYLGMLAQDVNQVFPELVSYTEGDKNGEGTYTMDYSGFGIVSIKAIQELKAEIELLKNEISTLKNK
jgi:hypothetical protein